MKAKYFMAALLAAFSMGFVATSCDVDQDPDTFLSEVKASTSYVSIPTEGGTAEVDITTTAAWEITDAPEWLTIAPASGEAGKTTVTFSAESTLDGRTAEVKVVCAGKALRINVIQGLATISSATCAEVIAGPDSKNYQVKGIVTSIANTTYGNWYLADNTGEIYIYGTLDAKGAEKNFTSLGIEVGDEVTVQGPKTTYGTTVELVNVTVIKIEKSLIKVECTTVGTDTTSTLTSDGGVIVAHLTNKGNGLFVDVPEDATDWLSLVSVSGNNVSFKVAANTGGARATTLIFRTTDGKKDYTAKCEISQAGLSGTLERPMTVEEAIAAANAGITTPVYIKGVVSKLVDSKNKAGEVVPGFNADYGNGSFWISADGAYNDDLALDFEVYQANWLENKKWTADNAQIAIGAEVIVYGPLTVYKGTAETQGKGVAYVYSVNGVTTDANGIGSQANPFTCAGAIAAANASVATKVYVSGIVSQLVNSKNKAGEYVPGFNADYGNGSFYMSADGVQPSAKGEQFEAYQVNWLENKKWTAEDPQIAVGDQVVIYGPLTTYSGLAETQGKGAAYVSSYAPAAK